MIKTSMLRQKIPDEHVTGIPLEQLEADASPLTSLVNITVILTKLPSCKTYQGINYFLVWFSLSDRVQVDIS